LADTDIVFQKEADETYNVYYYLTGVLPKNLRRKRNMWIKKLLSQQIPVRCLYPLSLPETQICRDMGIADPNLTPVAKDISKRIFNLYVHHGFRENEIIGFAKSTRKIYKSLI